MKNKLLHRIFKNRTPALLAGTLAVLLVFTITFLTSFKSSYQSYWQAIYRVQTVDFNMISHAYPPLVRGHIARNEADLLKQLLESNFSIFGIAVDVCVDPQCSAYKEWATNSGRIYGELVEIPVYKDDNAPVIVTFEHAYSEKPHILASAEQELMGRIRLYRSTPPTIGSELWLFAKKALYGDANASRHIVYLSNFYFSIFLSISFFLLFILIRNYYLEKRLRKGIATLLRKGVMKSHV